MTKAGSQRRSHPHKNSSARRVQLFQAVYCLTFLFRTSMVSNCRRRVAAERTDMPIIFITGHGDIPKTVQAMKAGAVEFLTKPFNEEVLLSAIRQALERSRLALAQEAETARNSGTVTRHSLLASRRSWHWSSPGC